MRGGGLISVPAVILTFPNKFPKQNLAKLLEDTDAHKHSAEYQSWLTDFDEQLRTCEIQTLETIAAKFEEWKEQLFDTLDDKHSTSFLNAEYNPAVHKLLLSYAEDNNISLDINYDGRLLAELLEAKPSLSGPGV